MNEEATMFPGQGEPEGTTSGEAAQSEASDASLTVTDDLERKSADELRELIRKESDKKRRLLDEKQREKRKRQELQALIEEREKKEALDNQRYKELWEKAESQKKEYYERSVTKEIESTVREAAARAGCKSVADLMKVGDLNLIQFDEENWQVHGVDTFVEEARKEKPWLFEQKSPPVINATNPAGAAQPRKRTFEELSRDGKKSALAGGLLDLYSKNRR